MTGSPDGIRRQGYTIDFMLSVDKLPVVALQHARQARGGQLRPLLDDGADPLTEFVYSATLELERAGGAPWGRQYMGASHAKKYLESKHFGERIDSIDSRALMLNSIEGAGCARVRPGDCNADESGEQAA